MAERIITKYLESDGWSVREVQQPQRKELGDVIAFREDRCPKHGIGIEIKWDERAAKTGRYFIEVAVRHDGKPQKKGWARYTISDYIFFYDDTENCIHVVKTNWLKNNLIAWRDRYPNAKSYNKGFHGVGILVPRSVIHKHARTIYLDDDYREADAHVFAVA